VTRFRCILGRGGVGVDLHTQGDGKTANWKVFLYIISES
jgi:hypothetical protein